MKRDFNKWLRRSVGRAGEVAHELREWNTRTNDGRDQVRQSQLDGSDKLDLEKDKAKYEEDRARDIRVYGTNGIDAAVKANKLDALVFPVRRARGLPPSPDIRRCSSPSA
jgi:hypothetical protein